MSFLLGIVFSSILFSVMQVGLFAIQLIRHPRPPVMSERIDLGRIMQHDPDTFWALQPNLKQVEFQPQSGGPQRTFRVSTNELGLRNRPISEKGNRLRVLAIGDSTTFGQYVDDAETWPAQLQSLLDRNITSVEVINAGLIGATSFQGLSYLLNRGFELKPDIVIATYGFNDRADWTINDRSLYSPFSRSKAEQMLNSLCRPQQLPSLAPRPRVSAGEFLDILITMASECEARGVRIYFIVWPDPPQIQPDWNTFSPNVYKSLVAEAAFRSGAKTIDLRPAFHNAAETVFVDIVHASPAGCRIAAECIAETLRADFPRLQAPR